MNDDAAWKSLQSGTTSFARADGDRIVLRSEFAYVQVRLRDPGGRPRLVVEDLRTGQAIELDAIELESLAWARHDDLAPLLDPSQTRWIPDDIPNPIPDPGRHHNHASNGFPHTEMDLHRMRRNLRPDRG
ncbi:hypothetical protein [Mycolicibacterium wolinskyi]|uniref:hypothetical protein n=1 Tax=Mycolicibacterium wolinskyi TaxID=59750 RepID=UPI000835F9DC|nr:hypothetical protein [Mycolicibacterium wolinskyi]